MTDIANGCLLDRSPGAAVPGVPALAVRSVTLLNALEIGWFNKSAGAIFVP